MSLSNWLYKPEFRRLVGVGVATFGAMIIGYALWPEVPTKGAHHQLESFNDYFASIEPACPPILARRNELPIIPKEVENCEDKEAAHRKAYRDLAQAIRSANAAEDSVWLSYVQTRASIVGAALVLLTLGATAWAAWAAADAAQIAKESAVASAKAADAAEAAVVVARSTAESQLRAYVLHHHTRILSLAPPERVRANVTIRNSGQTPAKALEMRMAITVGQKGEQKDFRLPEAILQSRGSLAADAQVETEPTSQRPFLPNEYAAFQAGTLAIYVFGEVKYQDIFGNTHATKVRLFFDAASAGRTEAFSTDVEGNEST